MQAVMESSEQNCTYMWKRIMLQIHTKDITHDIADVKYTMVIQYHET